MRIPRSAALGFAGFAAAGLLLTGAGPASAAGGEGACRGPAATLSAQDCTAFRAAKAELKQAKPVKPAQSAGRAARKAFKAEKRAWRAQLDALFAQYGLAVKK